MCLGRDTYCVAVAGRHDAVEALVSCGHSAVRSVLGDTTVTLGIPPYSLVWLLLSAPAHVDHTYAPQAQYCQFHCCPFHLVSLISLSLACKASTTLNYTSILGISCLPSNLVLYKANQTIVTCNQAPCTPVAQQTSHSAQLRAQHWSILPPAPSPKSPVAQLQRPQQVEFHKPRQSLPSRRCVHMPAYKTTQHTSPPPEQEHMSETRSTPWHVLPAALSYRGVKLCMVNCHWHSQLRLSETLSL